MSILVYRDMSAASAAAATLVAAQIIEKPDMVLGLPAGNMLEGVYARLCGMTGSGLLDWSDLHTLHVSEFVGFRPDLNRSLNGFLSHYLYSKVNAKRENIHMPDSCAQDLAAACTKYEELVMGLGGIDTALLSVGRNGHLAFNEPNREFTPLTHVSTLSQSTVEENMAYFADITLSGPPRAITLGMSTLLSAKKIVVLALGAGVADVVAKMINGPIAPAVPASILQLHPNTIFLLDEAAASRL